MDRTKFIDDLIDAGANDDEIAEALSLAEERNEFNGAQSQTPQKTLSRFEQSLFPSISHTGEAGKALPLGQAVKDTFKSGLDLLSFPVRAGGALRGQDIKDQSSAFFRPEMEKAKGAIDRTPEPPQIETDNTGKPPMFNPMGSFALQSGDKGYKDVLKGAVELGGNIASDPTVILGVAGKAIGSGLKAIGTKGNQMLGRLAQELSGVSEEALRKVGTGFGKGAKELKSAVSTQKEIGERLLDALDNFDQYLPEKQIVDEALQNMPAVNVKNTLQTLEKAKSTGMLSGTKKINEEINGLIQDIVAVADDQGNMPASQFVELRREIDKVIGDSFGKSTNDYILAAKKARYQMAQDLVDAAKQSGNDQYVEAMQSMANKLKLADEIKGYVGKSAQIRDRKIEQFISTLYGKNKSDRQRVVDGLGKIFGEDFLQESKLASLAAELGETGTAGLLPRQFTGRSVLGPALAGGSISAGLGPAALVPLALSSPRGAAMTLAGTYALGKGLAGAGKGVYKAANASKGVPAFAASANSFMLNQDLGNRRLGR